MNLPALGRQRYLVLLVILVASVLAQSMPIPRADYIRQFAVSIGTGAVFLVVFTEPRGRLLALWAGAAGIVAVWAQQILPPAARVPVEIAHNGLIILMFTLGVMVILRHLFERRSVRVDDIIGTMCGYIMLAAIWTNLYGAVDLLLPGSFSVPDQMRAQMSNWDGRHAVLNYFSLATLTTVGYGDVTATQGPATILATLEAVVGQFYIAVVVAQLVGVKLAQITNELNEKK
jgi:hypothetical protein